MLVDDERNTAYRVGAVEDGYAVSNSADRVIVVCRDEGSAIQYALLMNEAFEAGYKTGFRAARREG